MPTGYTAALYDGKEQSFEDFVLSCARAMGACVMQRDDPMSEPPLKQEPSDYHVKELSEARSQLAKLMAMKDEDANLAVEAERKERLIDRERHDREALELLARYQAMLQSVQQWQPPTPDHVGLKDFMIEQLQTSIDFDCHTGDWPKIPPVMTGPEWRQKQIEQLLHDIDYHTRENLKEIERTNGRNFWIDALYASLGRSNA